MSLAGALTEAQRQRASDLSVREQQQKELANFKQEQVRCSQLMTDVRKALDLPDLEAGGLLHNLKEMLTVVEVLRSEVTTLEEHSRVTAALADFLHSPDLSHNSPVRQCLVATLRKYGDNLGVAVLKRVLHISRSLAENSAALTDDDDNVLLTAKDRQGMPHNRLSIVALQELQHFFDDMIPVASGRSFRICVFQVEFLWEMYSAKNGEQIRASKSPSNDVLSAFFDGTGSFSVVQPALAPRASNSNRWKTN